MHDLGTIRAINNWAAVHRKRFEGRCDKHPKYFGDGSRSPNCETCLNIHSDFIAQKGVVTK